MDLVVEGDIACGLDMGESQPKGFLPERGAVVGHEEKAV